MGKKHQQPQPIDIFNAPSPRTLLTGGSSRPGVTITRTSAASATPSSSVAQSPVSRDGGAFPASPMPPNGDLIEDYGDAAERTDESSCASEVFSSDADDGHADEVASDNSSDEEDDDSDDSFDEGDDEELEEGDETRHKPHQKRNRSTAADVDDEDDEDEDESLENITVDFDAVEMEASDVDNVMHLMDQLIPDHRVEVDRDSMGGLLHKSSFTTLLKIAEDADEDEEEPQKADAATVKEVYGMVSLLNVVTNLKSHQSSLGQLMKILKENVWQEIAPGIAPHELLTSFVEDGSSSTQKRAKALWLVSEHIRTVPPELVARVLDFLMSQFEETYKPQPQATAAVEKSKKSKGKPSSSDIGASPLVAVEHAKDVAYPCMFVLLAKVQRDMSHSAEKSKKKLQRPSKGPRVEASSKIDLANEFVFWREEDEIAYRFRDPRVAVQAYRCRPQYDEQPEPERPITIAFALSSSDFVRALAEIAKLSSA